MPVMTADYDFWLNADDIVAFNDAVRRFDMFPNRSPEDAIARGGYVLENDEHVDVLVAPSISTVDGVLVRFAEVWSRRVSQPLRSDISVVMPCIDDLILTKRFGARPRDADDIRWLEHFREHRS